jgi:hypothetical protein
MKIDDSSSNKGPAFGGSVNVVTIDKNGKKRRKRKEKENGNSEHSVEKPKLNLGSSPFQLNEEPPVKMNGKCANEKINGKQSVHEEEKKSSEEEGGNRRGESASISAADEDTNSHEMRTKKERQLKKKLRQIENLEQKKLKNGNLTPEEQEKINKKGTVLQQLDSLKF